jgi:phage terminase Nu1 subunit (DNA packaging protein)
MPKRKPARRRPASKRGSKARASSPARAARLSLRGLARRLGVNLFAVQKAIASGRLSKCLGRDARGTVQVVDVELALQEWADNTTQPAAPTNGDGGLGSKTEADRLLALERREAVRLANQQRSGRLVDRGEVERTAFEIARTVRDRILAVPDRVAPQLAAETDAARVRRLLETELRAALVSLAESLSDDRGNAGAARDRGDHDAE